MNCDLHIRTKFSASASQDSCWKKVLTMCEEAKLDKIAITDFDSCLFNIINKVVDTTPYFSGTIIPGMECDVCESGKTFELLAYNFDVFKAMEWSYNTYGTLENRQTKIKDELIKIAKAQNFCINENIPFNGKVEFAHKYMYENLKSNTQNDWLFEKYNIKTLTDFYNLSTADTTFPLYVNLNIVWPTIDKVVNFIHSIGGIVVLCNIYKHKEINQDGLIDLCITKGVDGIEVYHPTNTPEQTEHLLNIAKAKNLVITGGSNYNGIKYTEVGIQDKDAQQNITNI